MTPQEVFLAQVEGDQYERLCVVHDETTFKGFYLCKTKKIFD